MKLSETKVGDLVNFTYWSGTRARRGQVRWVEVTEVKQDGIIGVDQSLPNDDNVRYFKDHSANRVAVTGNTTQTKVNNTQSVTFFAAQDALKNRIDCMTAEELAKEYGKSVGFPTQYNKSTGMIEFSVDMSNIVYLGWVTLPLLP